MPDLPTQPQCEMGVWIEELMETEGVLEETLAGQIEQGKEPSTVRSAVGVVPSHDDKSQLSELSDATPEQIFANWGSAADELVAVFERIKDRHSATAQLPMLQERLEAYAACWGSMQMVLVVIERALSFVTYSFGIPLQYFHTRPKKTWAKQGYEQRTAVQITGRTRTKEIEYGSHCDRCSCRGGDSWPVPLRRRGCPFFKSTNGEWPGRAVH